MFHAFALAFLAHVPVGWIEESLQFRKSYAGPVTATGCIFVIDTFAQQAVKEGESGNQQQDENSRPKPGFCFDKEEHKHVESSLSAPCNSEKFF